MSNDATPRLALPYVAAGQAQKHVTVNEAFARLDGLVQMAVETQTLSSAPNAPKDGSLYILAPSPTGTAWSGYSAGSVMRYEAGSWSALAIDEGTGIVHVGEYHARAAEDTLLQNHVVINADIILDLALVTDGDFVTYKDVLSERNSFAYSCSSAHMHKVPYT